MQVNGPSPDVLTFAGNGEPTAHPHFPEIIDDTIELRNRYFPKAKVSVLSNSTFINRPKVFEALMKVDNNILKLDTVSVDYIKMVDRPNGNYDLDAIIDRLKAFKGHVIIQTMFMKEHVMAKMLITQETNMYFPWLEVVKSIAPSQVMIYTIDRATPDKYLVKATRLELNRILDLLKSNGISATASY